MTMAKGGAEPGVGRAGKKNAVASHDRINNTKTLSEMNITKDQSSKWLNHRTELCVYQGCISQ